MKGSVAVAIVAQVIKPLCGAETWVEIEDYGQAKADVQQVFEWARQTDVKDVDHEFYETVEGGHGRIEMRCYWLLGATEHLVNAPLGPHLRRVGVVESEPRCSGQAPTIERRSYLLSLEGRVERAVRGHWGIENQVHWVLALGEDDYLALQLPEYGIALQGKLNQLTRL